MIKKQRSIVLFLIKFFGTYFLLFLLYSFYLKQTQQKEPFSSCSPITKSVAKQTSGILSFFGFENEYVQHDKEMSIKIILNYVYISRVIEGCNSVSIIILFLTFIIAFPGNIKATIIFGVVGSVLIYGINLLRIALLTVLLYKYPQEQILLHNLVFPAIIYGVTFFMWIVWVQKFSNYKK